MHVLPNTLAVPSEFWDNLATVLNEWNATSIVRDKVSLQLQIAGATETISVQLFIQTRDYGEWIDHA